MNLSRRAIFIAVATMPTFGCGNNQPGVDVVLIVRDQPSQTYQSYR